MIHCQSLSFGSVSNQFQISLELEFWAHLGCQAVAAEERLHAVRHLHLFVEHVPEQRRQQVFGVEERHEHPRQFVLR